MWRWGFFLLRRALTQEESLWPREPQLRARGSELRKMRTLWALILFGSLIIHHTFTTVSGTTGSRRKTNSRQGSIRFVLLPRKLISTLEGTHTHDANIVKPHKKPTQSPVFLWYWKLVLEHCKLTHGTTLRMQSTAFSDKPILNWLNLNSFNMPSNLLIVICPIVFNFVKFKLG